MAFRGRGRGRGRGGGAFGYDHAAKPAPHENFPEIAVPEMTCNKASTEEKMLVQSTVKFEDFWKTSCYHLDEDAPKKKNDDKEIERFSDRKRKTHTKREALSSYLKLTSSNFPAELLQGSRRGQASNKKLRWDKDSAGEQAFEAFEKLEETHKDGDKKAEKEGDDEDEPEEEEAEEEESSDDDYNQNIEFDDDDDDWNQEEEAQEDYYD